MSKNILIFSAIMLASISASAQNSLSNLPPQNRPLIDLEKIIKDRVEQSKRKNTEKAEASGDYSRSNPAPEQKNFTFSSPDGKTSVPVEIKGIKIGMSPGDFGKALKESVKNTNECMGHAIQTNELFPLGDYVIICQDKFVYFGSKMDYSEFYFLDAKLKYARLGRFSSSNENGDPLPPVVRALAESKFKQFPKVNDIKNPNMRGLGSFEFMWTDPNGDVFLYTTQYQFDLSGVVHKGGVIDMMSADFEKYTEERSNILRNAAKQQQQRMENKRKNDL